MKFHFVLPLLFLLLTTCQKSTERATPQGGTQTVPEESQSELAAAGLYPHTEKFKWTRDHGLSYYTNPKPCKLCHGKDLGGGNAKVACAPCHGIFPHSDDFKTTLLHGALYFKDRKTCTLCHGIDYAGGNSPFSCKTCHSYPHEPKWTLAKNHGDMFVKNQTACEKCHGEKDSLKERHLEHFISCGTCHPLMPHDKSFKDGDHESIAKTYQGQCTLCHTDLKRLMPNSKGDGCYFCHDTDEVPTVKWIKK